MAGTKRTPKRAGRRLFGSIRVLPSGRVQARYTDPTTGELVAAPTTFDTKMDAEAWLSLRHADLVRGTWQPERRKAGDGRTSLQEYAEGWLERRQLKPRSRAEYRRMLTKWIYPTLGSAAIASLEPEDITTWHQDLPTGPSERAHAYGLLKAILATAAAEDVIRANPCRIRGGAHVKRARPIRPATLDELEAIANAMPERLRLLPMLAAWCALRFGEITELRRKDVEVDGSVLHITRAITRADGGKWVATPKSAAGIRDVTVPPHLRPLVISHLERFTQDGPEGLLFPSQYGGQMAASTLTRYWYPAREKAGRPDLRFHDLRHTGATLAAATGATLAELMARLGHSTPQAALRYQHAAAERDWIIAEKLSELAQRD